MGLAKFTDAEMLIKTLIMYCIVGALVYLAIVKKFEPLLLLPIAFGMLLTNLPGAEIFHMDWFVDGVPVMGKALNPDGTISLVPLTTTIVENGVAKEITIMSHEMSDIIMHIVNNGGFLDFIYLGVKLSIYPCIIFMGVGAMTDFSPLIANPKTLFLGAAAQLGVFIAFWGALVSQPLTGFTELDAAAIGIIGGADGPTAIYVTSKLAPHLLGAIAIAAYSYMALIPMIQPPLMRMMVPEKLRKIKMETLRPVSKLELVIFPIAVTAVVTLIVPSAGSLVGLLMFGNLLTVSGVTERLSKTAQNEFMNIITICLGISVGATAKAENFLSLQTVFIIVLGLVAFSLSTIGGLIGGRVMCWLTKGKINPLIGSAGVSAVPMAARVAQIEGQKADPSNFLLMHAMGPNVAGVIGSAVAAGVFMALFG
ncbi:MAG: sodium ion-translocating decarboxylase subunit beta [Clostridia bacterium]|nr:sodium ion-translocating decarboxylase subunit beta [Clostridia bacterium]